MENLSQEEKRKKAQKEQLRKLQAVKAISNPDSPWTLTQEILQEVVAGFTVANPNVEHEVPKLVKALKKEIEARYKDDEDIKHILLESIPSDRSVRAWTKKDGWEDAVWGLVRQTGLFTPQSRAAMIQAVFSRGLDKSDQAAKLWLTLSGDYSEKLEVTDNAVEKFREINKILLKKKQDKE